MHKPQFIKIIDEVANILEIKTTHFSENWGIKLSKDGVSKFIIGNTFSLNNASSNKIAQNKNLCSEILNLNNIANVPHKLLFSPTILQKRNCKNGNREAINQFIKENGFPFLIKKNNSLFEILFRGTDSVDTTHRRHDDHIIPLKQ